MIPPGCTKRNCTKGTFLHVLALGLALLYALATSYAHAQAPSPRTVEVSYEVTLSDKTPEEAQRLALQRAQAEAVRRVAGTQVQAERSRVTIETERDVDDRFSEVVRTAVGGHVTGYDVLAEGIQRRGRSYVYRVVIQATVQPSSGKADPGFRATLRLNDDDHVYVARTPRTASDEIVVTAEVSQDAHLTLFSFSRDTLQVIWPNALDQDAFAPANTPVAFPPAEWRAQGLRLRAELPDGIDHMTERLVLVATKTRIPFKPTPRFDVQEGALATVRAGAPALDRWLVRIPLDQRAIATATYSVRRGAP